MSNTATAEIVQHQASAIVPNGAVTPMDMLEKAVSSGAGIEVIGRMMDFQERWEKNRARKAFDEAISLAKAGIPPITKNAKGHNDKRYANFAAIASTVDPILSQHGLSYRFRTTQTDKAISVTCVLSHRDGHSEETTLSGPADTSGSKNAIQAIGSTLTYLQRYSLVQMLGLAASEDDDGKAGAAGGTITDAQVLDLRELIEAVGANEVQTCKVFKIERLADLPAAKYQEAVTRLNEYGKRNKGQA